MASRRMVGNRERLMHQNKCTCLKRDHHIRVSHVDKLSLSKHAWCGSAPVDIKRIKSGMLTWGSLGILGKLSQASLPPTRLGSR